MAKSSAKRPHRRAYVNPLPGFPEAAQRIQIEQYGEIDEWYVESRSVTRTDFIQHLRPGDEAVVARAGCFAAATGKLEPRLADLAEARGDVHAQCAILVSADNRLNSKENWPAMKAAARVDLNAFKNMVNASARKHIYTDRELELMERIRLDKRYTNDKARLAAVGRAKIDGRKIKVPGRTWFVTELPRLIVERGIEI